VQTGASVQQLAAGRGARHQIFPDSRLRKDACTTLYSDEFDEDGDGNVHDGHPYCLAESPEGNLVKTICGPCSCEAGLEARYTERALVAGWPSNAYIECRACQRGQYKSEVGSGVCSPCEKGSYANSTGATACTECGAGHYSSLESARSCTECGIGNFSDVSRMTACRKCYHVRSSPGDGMPGLWVTMELVLWKGAYEWDHVTGANSSSFCGCDDGPWESPAGQCYPCGEGLVCSGIDASSRCGLSLAARVTVEPAGHSGACH